MFDFSAAPLVGSAVGDAEGADVPVVVQASLQPRPNARIAWLRQLVTMPYLRPPPLWPMREYASVLVVAESTLRGRGSAIPMDWARRPLLSVRK